MREYKITDAFDVLNKSFAFLSEEWGFKKIREDNINYGCYFKYLKNKLTIYIGYEYINNFFHFEFLMEEKRQLIFSFFREKESDIEWKSFMPDDFQYKESLRRNVEYIKKYKNEVLKMAE